MPKRIDYIIDAVVTVTVGDEDDAPEEDKVRQAIHMALMYQDASVPTQLGVVRSQVGYQVDVTTQ